MDQIGVSIVVLTYNNLETCTKKCLASLFSTISLKKCEVIIVDNNSIDGTKEWLLSIKQQNLPNVQIILNTENFGYAEGNNIGILKARGDIVILLNNDTLLSKGWLDKLLSGFDETTGLVGPITNRIGSMQQVTFPGVTSLTFDEVTKRYTHLHANEYFDVEKLCFFCVAIKRSVIEKIGLLDKNFGIGNFEDDDYCFRVRSAGYKLRIAEGCFIYHMGSISFSKMNKSEYQALIQKNLKYFEKKHSVAYGYENLLRDYYYIKQHSSASESYLFRQPIYALINSQVKHNYLPVGLKAKIKKFDSQYLFGLIGRSYFLLKKVKKIHCRINVYHKFYQNYGIRGLVYRLKEKTQIVRYSAISLPSELPVNIPIFIISYNRLICLKQLVEYLSACGLEKNIVILDNNSTYPPLLDYLASIQVKVVYLKKNYGHLALWKSRLFESVITTQPFVLTDCDVIPDANCPLDFLNHFYSKLLKNEKLTKVGFALSIDDIPENYFRKKEVILWELKHWQHIDQRDPEFFDASIDTTFAVYRPNVMPYMSQWWSSARSNYPYIARHYPWYITNSSPENVLQEEKFYQESIKSKFSHWYSKA